jgi:hypothetical protein
MALKLHTHTQVRELEKEYHVAVIDLIAKELAENGQIGDRADDPGVQKRRQVADEYCGKLEALVQKEIPVFRKRWQDGLGRTFKAITSPQYCLRCGPWTRIRTQTSVNEIPIYCHLCELECEEEKAVLAGESFRGGKEAAAATAAATAAKAAATATATVAAAKAIATNAATVAATAAKAIAAATAAKEQSMTKDVELMEELQKTVRPYMMIAAANAATAAAADTAPFRGVVPGAGGVVPGAGGVGHDARDDSPSKYRKEHPHFYPPKVPKAAAANAATAAADTGEGKGEGERERKDLQDIKQSLQSEVNNLKAQLQVALNNLKAQLQAALREDPGRGRTTLVDILRERATLVDICETMREAPLSTLVPALQLLILESSSKIILKFKLKINQVAMSNV